MKKLILFFLFCPIILLGNQNPIDSLSQKLKTAKHETIKCEILNQMIELEMDDNLWPKYNEQLGKIAHKGFYGRNNRKIKKVYGKYYAINLNNIAYLSAVTGQFDKAIESFNQCITIQKQINDIEGLTSTYINLGNVYREIGKHEKSIECYQKTYDLHKKHKNEKGMADAMYFIGYSYDNQGRKIESLNTYHKALKIYEKVKDEEGMAMVINNLAFIYNSQGDTKTAFEYYNRSLDLNKKLKNELGIGASYNNIGKTYQKKKDYNLALKFYNQGLKKFLSIYNKPGIGISYNNIGDIYSLKKDYQKALDFYNKSIGVRLEINDKEGLTVTYSNLSEIYFAQNKIQLAQEFGTKSLALAREVSDPESIKKAAFILSKIFEKQNSSGKSLEMYKLYILMRDSINNISTQKEAITKAANYKYEKKALADSLKVAQERKVSNLKFQREKVIKNNLILTVVATIVILFLLVFILIYLSKTIKDRKAAYVVLENKNLEIEYQSKKLVELSKQVTKYQTQMNPHFVFNALNNIQGFVVNDQKTKALNQLQNFSKLMRQTLNNSDADTIPLKTEIDFLKLYLKFETEKFDNEIHFEIIHELDEENVLIQPMLIQPLLENCLKHAGLNTIEKPMIQLVLTEISDQDLLKVEVKDNGNGINKPLEQVYESSHALGILKSRLKLIYDQYEMISQEQNITVNSNNELVEKGTSIVFYIPYLAEF